MILLVYAPSFENELKIWVENIKSKAEETIEEKTYLNELYDKWKKGHEIFTPLAEQLPIKTEEWLFGEEYEDHRARDVTFILEQFGQSIFLSSVTFFDSANHSARCSLEHTLQFIWKIGYPINHEHMDKVGSNITITDIIDEIFNIPKFKLYDEEYGLKSDIKEVYRFLSRYVHAGTSNSRAGRIRRPHITVDFGKRHIDETQTEGHLKKTFRLIIILLCLTYGTGLVCGKREEIKGLLDEDTFDNVFEFLDNW